MSLKDKVIVITGASRGIGHAIAVRAAQDGAKLFPKTPPRPPKSRKSTYNRYLSFIFLFWFARYRF